MKNYSPKQITDAWCMYDWANSAFATSVMAAILPIFFRNVACVGADGNTLPIASSIWGYTSAIAMVFIALISLLLGTAADYGSSRKHYLKIFIFIGTTATAALALTAKGDWLLVAIIFIVANVGYACSELFYNSLLPHISHNQNIDRISSRGYAFGYMGGGLLLLINVGMVYLLPGTVLEPGTSPVPLTAMRLTFLSVGIWWLLFSLPILQRVPEPCLTTPALNKIKIIKLSFTRLKTTFISIRHYKQLFLFIVAYWFYNDGIGTTIKMAAIFGNEIGISTLDLIGALTITQLIGIPCSFAFGRLARFISPKKAILIGLVVYLCITISAFFMQTALHFWLLAGTVGIVQGGTQALSRSLFSSMLPKEKSAEFFSFYNVSGKFAGIAGPLLFGLASQISGSSRFGILSLIIFFITGGILLIKVNVNEARQKSQ